MESDLLRYLVLNRGRIISRKELLDQVWRVREDTDTRAIDNTLYGASPAAILKTIPPSPLVLFLETVRGVGYRFGFLLQPKAPPPRKRAGETELGAVNLSECPPNRVAPVPPIAPFAHSTAAAPKSAS